MNFGGTNSKAVAIIPSNLTKHLSRYCCKGILYMWLQSSADLNLKKNILNNLGGHLISWKALRKNLRLPIKRRYSGPECSFAHIWKTWCALSGNLPHGFQAYLPSSHSCIVNSLCYGSWLCVSDWTLTDSPGFKIYLFSYSSINQFK